MAENEDQDSLESQLSKEVSEDSDSSYEAANILEGELIDSFDSVQNSRAVRIINKSFSLAEYSAPFTKIQWFLFIEIYEIVKQFYLGNTAKYIESFTKESITVRVPVNSINKNFFNPSNRSKQLRSAADGLMSMRVRNYIEADEHGQVGFDFITMFPRITYNPKVDKDHIVVRIQAEVYEEMVPIRSYAQLDLQLTENLETGHDQHVYAILKSHAYRGKATLSFEGILRQIGLYDLKTYRVWKHFNQKVFAPAVERINKHQQYDIYVEYSKRHGKDEIDFKFRNNYKQRKHHAEVLSLDELIDARTRIPNLLQRRYLQTTLKNCTREVQVTSMEELMSWVISDLISMQRKSGRMFNFKHAVNGISKQISTNVYSEPYAHKHLLAEADQDDTIELALADEFIQREIARLEKKGLYDEIKARFTDQELKVNKFGHLIEQLKDLDD